MLFRSPGKKKAVSKAPPKKKGPQKKRRKDQPLSWIWVVQTKGPRQGEKQAMNEGERIAM